MQGSIRGLIASILPRGEEIFASVRTDAKIMFALSGKWKTRLISQPETGMGYYIVSVILRDGTRFNQVIVDSGYVTRIRGMKTIPYDDDDIEDIIITHDKWDFRHEGDGDVQ